MTKSQSHKAVLEPIECKNGVRIAFFTQDKKRRAKRKNIGVKEYTFGSGDNSAENIAALMRGEK